MAEKKPQTTFTARIYADDKTAIYSQQKASGLNMAEYFNKVVLNTQTEPNNSTPDGYTWDETQDLTLLLEAKTNELNELQKRFNALEAERLEQQNILLKTTGQIEAFKIELEKIKDDNKAPAAPELSKYQFICTLEGETAELARKIRSFVLKAGIVDTATGYEYINQLTNAALKKFVTRFYNDLT